MKCRVTEINEGWKKVGREIGRRNRREGEVRREETWKARKKLTVA